MRRTRLRRYDFTSVASVAAATCGKAGLGDVALAAAGQARCKRTIFEVAAGGTAKIEVAS